MSLPRPATGDTGAGPRHCVLAVSSSPAGAAPPPVSDRRARHRAAPSSRRRPLVTAGPGPAQPAGGVGGVEGAGGVDVGLHLHLVLLERAEHALVDALVRVADDHIAEPDVATTSRTLAGLDERRRAELTIMLARYPLHGDPPTTGQLPGVPGGGTLLADLHDLYTFVAWVDMAWSIVGQGARALRDTDLRDLAERGLDDTTRHLRWIRGRINQAAAQTLVLG